MGKRSPLAFLADQFASIPPLDSFRADLTNRNIVIVGASSGIGLEAARHMASTGPAKMILACRNVDKANDALRSVQGSSKGNTKVEVWELDLLSFASVQAFADRFQDNGENLDLLVLNAGINTETYRKTKDGFESVLTNHLGGALLSVLLLPHLLKASPSPLPALPRLVVVNTDGHYWAKTPLSVKEGGNIFRSLSEEGYCNSEVMADRYNISKLISLLFTRAIATRLSINSKSSLTVTSVSPGWCRSALNRDLTFPLTLVAALLSRIFGRSAEAGGRIVVHACIGSCGGGGKEMHGRFLCKCQILEESDFAISEEGRTFERRVWDDTISILSAASEHVPEIVSQCLPDSTDI